MLNVFVALKDKAGNDLVGTVAQSVGGQGYVKYSSGLIIQYGYCEWANYDSENGIPFPISFTSEPRIFLGVTGVGDSQVMGVLNPGLSAFKMFLRRLDGSNGIGHVRYLAIGY